MKNGTFLIPVILTLLTSLMLGWDYSHGVVKNELEVVSGELLNQTMVPINGINTTTPPSTSSPRIVPKNDLLGQTSSTTDQVPKTVIPAYKIKVTFDSITIHDDREGSLSGDGEFDLSAYVQDKRVYLTDASGIWDAVEGETYSFDPGTEVTVETPETSQLSIFTAGVEVDGEPRIPWQARDDDLHIARLIAELYDPNMTEKELVLKDLRAQLLNPDNFCIPDCNHNDRLGEVAEWYNQPAYGTGFHEEKAYAPDFTLRYTISVTPPPKRQLGEIPPPTRVLEEVPPTCNSNLPVNTVTSSGSQTTFPPTNAIDNNPSTRWFSTNTLNPFITLDLGSQNWVCSVDIAWADGNLHPYRFNVSVSDDGNTFTNAFSGTSTGTTTSPEKYTLTDPEKAKFVKITITQSTPGVPNSIAQISEIDLFGANILSSNRIQPSGNLTISEAEDTPLDRSLTNRSGLASSTLKNATTIG